MSSGNTVNMVYPDFVKAFDKTLLGFLKFNNSEEKHMSSNIICICLNAHKNE